jgi:ChrB-like protein
VTSQPADQPGSELSIPAQDWLPAGWLLLIYRVPQDPASRRTYVWRQLRQLGAIYLQQAAAILPQRPAQRAALEALAQRIDEFGGEVSLLTTVSPSAAWEQRTIERFDQARAAEYAELEENVERFQDEIRRETRKERFTFAELEDLEADWEKLQRWHGRIKGRDFFATAASANVEQLLDEARHELQTFTDRVYAAQADEMETV